MRWKTRKITIFSQNTLKYLVYFLSITCFLTFCSLQGTDQRFSCCELLLHMGHVILQRLFKGNMEIHLLFPIINWICTHNHPNYYFTTLQLMALILNRAIIKLTSHLHLRLSHLRKTICCLKRLLSFSVCIILEAACSRLIHLHE